MTNSDTNADAVTDTITLDFKYYKKIFMLINRIRTIKDHDEIKDLARSAATKILKSSANWSFEELIEDLSLSELRHQLVRFVGKLDHAKVKIILDTKIISKDDPKLSDICSIFEYESTTDDAAHDMLKLLTDYGFNWRDDNYAACYDAICNKFVRVVELLLDLGMNVDHTFAYSKRSLIEHTTAGKSWDIVELLIKRGASTACLNKSRLPEHLQKLIDERASSMETSKPSPVTLAIKSQNDKIAQLLETINKETSSHTFEKYTTFIDGIYQHLVNKMVCKYNAENPEFVASYDPDSTALTVIWKD